MDERTKFLEIRNLTGMKGCICGGYKRGGDVSYPGRSANLPWATHVKRRGDGFAEVSRRHSSSFDPSEGLNVRRGEAPEPRCSQRTQTISLEWLNQPWKEMVGNQDPRGVVCQTARRQGIKQIP